MIDRNVYETHIVDSMTTPTLLFVTPYRVVTLILSGRIPSEVKHDQRVRVMGTCRLGVLRKE